MHGDFLQRQSQPSEFVVHVYEQPLTILSIVSMLVYIHVGALRVHARRDTERHSCLGVPTRVCFSTYTTASDFLLAWLDHTWII